MILRRNAGTGSTPEQQGCVTSQGILSGVKAYLRQSRRFYGREVSTALAPQAQLMATIVPPDHLH